MLGLLIAQLIVVISLELFWEQETTSLGKGDPVNGYGRWVTAYSLAGSIPVSQSSPDPTRRPVARWKNCIVSAIVCSEASHLALADTSSYQSQIAAVLSANLPPSDDNRPYSAIHVRRGDYVDNAIIAAKFGPLEVPYFVEALRNSGASKVVIVSDDGDWCGEILAPAIESELGICVEVARGGTFLEDFATLTRAETLVLSNSTFSWWAAFVGQQTSVIYPTPWMVSAGGELGLPGWTPLARDA